MMSRIPGLVFYGLVLALCIPAAWLLGNKQATQRAALQLEQLQSLSDQEQSRLQFVVGTLETEKQQLALSLEIADSRAAALQAELDDTLRQSIDDASELALYRRIAGAETGNGLWVDSVTRSGALPEELSITLMQAQGRDRVSGDIGLTFVGGRDGTDQRWLLADAATGELEEAPVGRDEIVNLQPDELLVSSVGDSVVRVTPYEFRFFQTLLVTVGNITTINPDYVEIWILPEGEGSKPVVQRFRWTEIASVTEQ